MEDFFAGIGGGDGEWWVDMSGAKFFSVLAATLCSWSLVGEAEDYVAQTFSGEGGKTLGYRLLAPAKMEEGKKYPLVLFLHGAGERGSDNGAQLKHGASLFLKPEVREKFPCFVLAPQCPNGQTWSEVKGWTGPSAYSGEPTEVMRLVMGALALTIKEQPVDGERIYVTGLSMGGYGSWDL
ncbi:MAG: PHB depolymerase family esterase, partial [Verrucomicrobiota bacterium]